MIKTPCFRLSYLQPPSPHAAIYRPLSYSRHSPPKPNISHPHPMTPPQPAAHRFAPMAKNMLASTGNPYASAAATALGALGYGQPNHKALENKLVYEPWLWACLRFTPKIFKLQPPYPQYMRGGHFTSCLDPPPPKRFLQPPAFIS